MTADPVPEEFRGVTPHLVVADATAAITFYQHIFDADELTRSTGPDGRTWHCELLLAGGRVILMEEFPDMGVRAPSADAPTSVLLQVFVPDTDSTYAAALDAGAAPLMEPNDAFWGDRYAQFQDPAGHRWALSTRRHDLTATEMRQNYDEWSHAHGNPDSPGDTAVPREQ